MIKSSFHNIAYSNTNKKSRYNVFLTEYRSYASDLLDFLWNNRIDYKIGKFDIKNNHLDIPKFLSTKDIKISTELSARAKNCAVNQVLGIIRSITSKRKKQLYVLSNTDKYPMSENKRKKLIEKLSTPLTKPDISNINPELNSICCKFIKKDNFFNGFLKLFSLGKRFGKILIPIKFHKQNKKLIDWKMMTSFLITEEQIQIRWEKSVEKKTSGEIVGADSGVNAILTLSDQQKTNSLTEILKKLSRKRKGSKAFARAQKERTNSINYSINRLNFDKIRQINLENVKNLRFKQKTNRFLSHFTYPAIRQKLEDRCEALGVQVKLTSSPFKSQRCSACDWVQKKNRSGESFNCQSCGFSANADYNSSLNQLIDLPSVWSFVKSGMNKTGFYWNSDGVYDRFGQELAVPVSQEK